MTAQLTTLIRLRQYEVDRGQSQLASLQRQEQIVTARLTNLDQETALHRSQLETLSRAGRLNIDAIRLRRQYLQQLAEQRTGLLAEVTAAQSATMEQRERLIAADQRLKVAEKLRERALVAAQARNLQQEALDCEESWRVSALRPRDNG